MKHLAVAAAWLIVAPSLHAQGVLVAPHAVIMDQATRGAAITLYNPGSEPAEVSISLFFGYPVTDSVGEFDLATPGDTPSESAAGWIEAYPRRLVIGPLERQTVRLLARTPAGLPDGEYWARIMITAKGGQAPVAMTDSTADGIQVGLNLEVRTILPLQYRRGAVRTAARIGLPRVARMGDSLVVRTKLDRDGNAAFLGTARGALVDATGVTVASFATPIALYHSIDPRFTLPVAAVPAGRYRLTVTVAAERADLAPDQLLKAAPVSATVDVVIP
ncbi:MAG: hypothetical protein ACKVZ0_16425 [Gemmatimonadales bacterium]